ncbi:MAG TPA: hypothetical protein VFE33_06000 [Thermoanaerobaculia bacterium]|nr:hypothetical protein [Thermoanaerobaculia bacterium]
MLGGIVESLEEIARTAVTPPPPAANFQGLEFLVGGVWVNTASGSTTCEALQFTLSAQFISSVQTSCRNNKAVLTTGLLGLDPSGKHLVMWAFTSSGSYVSLTQVPPTPGPGPAATWTLEGMVQQTKIRQTLHKVSADAMQTVTSKFVQGGGWQALPPVPYQRS